MSTEINEYAKFAEGQSVEVSTRGTVIEVGSNFVEVEIEVAPYEITAGDRWSINGTTYRDVLNWLALHEDADRWALDAGRELVQRFGLPEGRLLLGDGHREGGRA